MAVAGISIRLDRYQLSRQPQMQLWVLLLLGCSGNNNLARCQVGNDLRTHWTHCLRADQCQWRIDCSVMISTSNYCNVVGLSCRGNWECAEYSHVVGKQLFQHHSCLSFALTFIILSRVIIARYSVWDEPLLSLFDKGLSWNSRICWANTLHTQ